MANHLIGRDLAVDLGTAATLVHVRGGGVILDEPTMVLIDQETGATVAVGSEARRLTGRPPAGTVSIRPVQGGVVADLDATARFLRGLFALAHRRRYFTRPRMVICVPSTATPVERSAVVEAAHRAGARRVHLIDQSLAAAVGAGLPVHRSSGHMIVDIGSGVTEAAVLSLGGTVVGHSVRIGGDAVDEALRTWFKNEHSLLLGEGTAEDLKIRLGSASAHGPAGRIADVRGRDLRTGLPRTVTVAEEMVRAAIEPRVRDIVEAVRLTLDRTPPDLVGDIMDHGIVLTGGGALLRGLDERLRTDLAIPVHLAPDPLAGVVIGAGRSVEEFEAFAHALDGDPRRSA